MIAEHLSPEQHRKLVNMIDEYGLFIVNQNTGHVYIATPEKTHPRDDLYGICLPVAFIGTKAREPPYYQDQGYFCMNINADEPFPHNYHALLREICSRLFN